eukprot:14189241-Alexandrium_andersonii.AAC.1
MSSQELHAPADACARADAYQYVRTFTPTRACTGASARKKRAGASVCASAATCNINSVYLQAGVR